MITAQAPIHSRRSPSEIALPSHQNTHSPNTHDIQMNRFVGDGLDYRRPVMSHPRDEVIDLTEEASSPPVSARPGYSGGLAARQSSRPHHPIIDLDQEYGDDEPEIQHEHTRDPSPDFEVLYSRAAPPRSRSAGNAASRDGSGPRRTGPTIPHNEFRRGMEELRRGMANVSNQIGIYRHSLLPQAPGRHHHHGNLHPPIMHQHQHQVPNDRDLFVNLEFHLPDQLDFETQGFRMGDVAQPRPQPPPPTYDAPPMARPGYTRSPKEDDVLVCPNCSDELGVGDSEEKRQVWVIKRCGHVSHLLSLGTLHC